MTEIQRDDGRGLGGRTRTFLVLASILVAVLLAGAVAPVGAANGVQRDRTDVLGQGGEGVLEEDGALLARRNKVLRIGWTVPTPEPGSYAYPTADMIPPGAPPHPEIVPGYPEVFTLWAFVFNFPELCTDNTCDFDDIGDTPAQGGVFQLDAIVATDDRIDMRGKIRTKDTPANGAKLQAPMTAEVHVAMAPHGQAACGDDLVRQLNGGVGGPPQWFPALFV
ncbi:MAG: hypothetical protein ACR2P0_17515 [Acidimicrobiales bacterium]